MRSTRISSQMSPKTAARIVEKLKKTDSEKEKETCNEREIIYKIDMLHHVPWILMHCLRTFMSSRERVLGAFHRFLVVQLFPCSIVNLFSDFLHNFISSKNVMWIVTSGASSTTVHNATDSLKSAKESSMKFKLNFTVFSRKLCSSMIDEKSVFDRWSVN